MAVGLRLENVLREKAAARRTQLQSHFILGAIEWLGWVFLGSKRKEGTQSKGFHEHEPRTQICVKSPGSLEQSPRQAPKADVVHFVPAPGTQTASSRTAASPRIQTRLRP